MPARTTNANGVLPNEEFGHVQVQSKAILRVPVPFADVYNSPTPSQQHDKFGVGINTPELRDQCFEENLVDRSGPVVGNEAIVSNSMISRHIMSPMVSAILDELTETASSILAEDDAGLALLDSQIEETCNFSPSFKHVDLPRLRVGSFNSSDSPSNSVYAAGVGNLKQSYLSTTMQVNEKCPSGLSVLNAIESEEGCVAVETRGMNLAAKDTTGDFAPSFEGSNDNQLRGTESHEQVNILKHHYNALAHLDFTPEVRETY